MKRKTELIEVRNPEIEGIIFEGHPRGKVTVDVTMSFPVTVEYDEAWGDFIIEEDMERRMLLDRIEDEIMDSQEIRDEAFRVIQEARSRRKEEEQRESWKRHMDRQRAQDMNQEIHGGIQ